MAAKIWELRQRRANLVSEANARLESYGGGPLTATQTAEQDRYDEQLAAIDAELKTEERKLDRERMYGSAAGDGPRVPGSGPQPDLYGIRDRADDDPRRGFRVAARRRPSGSTLTRCAACLHVRATDLATGRSVEASAPAARAGRLRDRVLRELEKLLEEETR